MRPMIFAPGMILLAALGVSRAAAADVILSENFDNLDLSKLPQNWSSSGGADVSLIDEAGHGKVLHISGKGNNPGLTISLDPAKVCGHTLQCEALAKSAAFMPVPEKHGFPQMMLQYSLQGQGWKGRYCAVQSNPDGWQRIGVTFAIPPNAIAVRLVLRVNVITADVSFDNLTLQSDGAAVAAPAGQPRAEPPQAAAAAALPAPQNANPVSKAAQVAARQLDLDGFGFNSEIAAFARQARKADSVPNSIALVGPGAPIKELEMKSLMGKSIVAAKEVSGVPAERLTVLLPEFLVKNKPEVVILAGESALSRTLAQNERFDWEDAARICARFGAVPVLAVPGGEKQAELRQTMVSAAEAAHCSVLDLHASAGKRLAQLLETLDIVVFERAAASAAKTEEE